MAWTGPDPWVGADVWGEHDGPPPTVVPGWMDPVTVTGPQMTRRDTTTAGA